MDVLGGGFWLWIQQHGGWGVAIVLGAFLLFLVLTGRLVTRSSVDQLMRTIEKQSDALDKQAIVLPQVLEHMRTADKIFTALQDRLDRERSGSGSQ